MPGKSTRICSLVTTAPFLGVNLAMRLMSVRGPPASSHGTHTLYEWPSLDLLYKRFELLCRIDDLSIGDHVGRVAVGLVKHIDDERSVYLHRLLAVIGAEEVQPPAEAAGWPFLPLGEHRIDPGRLDTERLLDVASLHPPPRDVLAEIKLRAAAREHGGKSGTVPHPCGLHGNPRVSSFDVGDRQRIVG